MSELNHESLSLGKRLKHAWDAFRNRDQQVLQTQDLGPSYFLRPDKIRFRGGTEHSIVASIYTRIAIDVSSIRIKHARLDENGRFVDTVDSGLNYCLNTEANIDQTSRDFFQDLVESMCDEGVIAAVPTVTTINPRLTGSYDIKEMRVAKIVQWYPEHVRLKLYNDRTGRPEEIVLPKKVVAIIQNPLYNVMNEPNSTLRRLIHKLNILDAVDEQTGSGKLDLIVHLPYMTKTPMRKQEAIARRKELEEQLANSKYGIAYADATEKITQLNRPVENNLMNQIEYLTSMLYSQLGMTKEVFDGTADEKTMLNYYNRTIEPIVSAISDEFNRKFLTKTARAQKQKIVFFRDLMKLAPLESIVEFGTQFTGSAIVSPNEVRQILGLKPSEEDGANDLTNRNINPTGHAAMVKEQPQKQGFPSERLASTKVSQISKEYEERISKDEKR